MLQARHKPAADQQSGYPKIFVGSFDNTFSCSCLLSLSHLLPHSADWHPSGFLGSWRWCLYNLTSFTGVFCRALKSHQVSTHFIRSTGSSCAAAVLSIREYTHTSASFWR